jgi:hypothetical protein
MVKVNGKRMKLILIAINTRENTKMIRSMAKVNSTGSLEITILVTISLIKGMDMERCIGKMDLFTKETGSKECSMDLALLLPKMEKLEKVNLRRTYTSLLYWMTLKNQSLCLQNKKTKSR